MAYVVEKITPEDQEKILSDAACDPEKLKILTYAFGIGDSVLRNWVVDRAKNYYTLVEPKFARPESTRISKYFYFSGRFYEFQEAFYGDEILIINAPPESLLGEFREELALAYIVGNPRSTSPITFKNEGV